MSTILDSEDDQRAEEQRVLRDHLINGVDLPTLVKDLHYISIRLTHLFGTVPFYRQLAADNEHASNFLNKEMAEYVRKNHPRRSKE